jgi:hydrogenase maturation protease
MAEAKPTLVLGIGNYLMGDEGVGIHAVNYLQELDWPSQVEFMDGGTGGFFLLGLFEAYDPIIIIDACMDDNPPGSLRVFHPRFGSECPPMVSMHDVGLRDLLESAALLDTLPDVHLITVSIANMDDMTVELSDKARSVLPGIESAVRNLLLNPG